MHFIQIMQFVGYRTNDTACQEGKKRQNASASGRIHTGRSLSSPHFLLRLANFSGASRMMLVKIGARRQRQLAASSAGRASLSLHQNASRRSREKSLTFPLDSAAGVWYNHRVKKAATAMPRSPCGPFERSRAIWRTVHRKDGACFYVDLRGCPRVWAAAFSIAIR